MNTRDPHPADTSDSRRSALGIEFHRPTTFWTGVVLLMTGVLLHLPDYLSTASMAYRMAGMPMSTIMLAGMAMILSGFALAVHGLVPRFSSLMSHGAAGAAHYQIRAMDDARLTGAHWWLLFVLGVALVVDVMKPATLGFVVPGMRDEYGITAQVSLFPLSALTGTTIGSVLWGVLADRLGRRVTILLASLFFMGTGICGFMPAFGWQLLMCFYGKWSSSKTMILFAWLTVAVLVAFAAVSDNLTALSPVVIVSLLMALMVSSTGVITMLSPHAAEVFPAELRGTGSGVAAASSKMGGMIGPPMMGVLLSASAGITVPALVAALAMGLAALVLWFVRVETRGRGLERISDTIGVKPDA